LALPTTRPDELRITMMRDPRSLIDWPGCRGARCTLDQTPAFTHSIAWKATLSPAGGPSR